MTEHAPVMKPPVSYLPPLLINFNVIYGIPKKYYTTEDTMKLVCHVLERKSISDDELFRIIAAAAAAARQINAERPSDSQNPAESLEYCI